MHPCCWPVSQLHTAVAQLLLLMLLMMLMMMMLMMLMLPALMDCYFPSSTSLGYARMSCVVMRLSTRDVRSLLTKDRLTSEGCSTSCSGVMQKTGG